MSAQLLNKLDISLNSPFAIPYVIIFGRPSTISMFLALSPVFLTETCLTRAPILSFGST